MEPKKDEITFSGFYHGICLVCGEENYCLDSEEEMNNFHKNDPYACIKTLVKRIENLEKWKNS